MSEALEVHVFYEVAALLVLATLAGFVGTLLRQPLIVSFIAAGMLAGPSAFGIAQADDHVDLLAKLGVSLLLFLVGLKLDLALVRTIGTVALMTGLGQVVFTTVIGFAIALALGLDVVTSLYVAIALTFSSTIIIVKLLSDKREIDSLHGRIALGFLIVQDLVVVVTMIVLSAVGIGAGQDAGLVDIVLVLGYGLLMLAGVGLFARYVASPLVQWLSRTPELLVTFAIGWAALLAASGHYLGFGKELGGLLAGVSLASTPFREAIAARLASLRDFLLLFFFLALGASLDLSVLGASIAPAVVLSLFVLIGNPVIVMVIMGAMGYSKRPSFLAGLTVAQISEFSLIFVAMGISLGHIEETALGLVTLVGLVTIAASTYMITWSHELYRLLEPLLGVFERRRRTPHETGWRRSGGDYDVVLFGLGRYGSGIAKRCCAPLTQALPISRDRALGQQKPRRRLRTGRRGSGLRRTAAAPRRRCRGWQAPAPVCRTPGRRRFRCAAAGSCRIADRCRRRCGSKPRCGRHRAAPGSGSSRCCGAAVRHRTTR